MVADRSCSDPLPRSRFPWAFCAGATALAALLRFSALGQEALFLDEYFTLQTSTASGGIWSFWTYIRHHDPHPPLFFFLMRGWIAVFGDSPVSLRLPSALAGCAMVWVMMRCLYETRSANFLSLGLIGLLTALNPFLIYYSQEARAYSFLALLTACNLLFLIRIWAREGPGLNTPDLAGLALVAALAALTHYFGLFLLALDVVFLIFRLVLENAWPPRIRRNFYFPIGAFLLLGWLSALGAGIVVAGVRIAGHTDMISWLPRWEPVFLWYQWRAIAEGPLHFVAPAWCMGAALAAWILAFVAAGRPSPRGAAFIIPILLSFLCISLLPHLISMFHPLLFYGQRYMVFSAPVFLLLTAWPALWSRRPWLQSFFLFVFVLASVPYLTDYYRYRQKRTWDTAADKCMEFAARDGLVWYLTDEWGGPLLYYLRDGKVEVEAHRHLADFPSPALEIRRLAAVSIHPQLVQMQPPEGFRARGGVLLETHWKDQEILVRFFERKNAGEQETHE